MHRIRENDWFISRNYKLEELNYVMKITEWVFCDTVSYQSPINKIILDYVSIAQKVYNMKFKDSPDKKVKEFLKEGKKFEF